ncbi:MAG: ATP-binding protein [Spirochaetes bacterium]|nr:ATP-binding protein [Spirochaetota bacterium]
MPILFALFLLSAVGPALISAQTAIPLDDNLSIRNISGEVEYLKDPANRLTLADIMRDGSLVWTAHRSGYINFGHSSARVWFRFIVDNRTGKPFNWICEVDSPALDTMELYVPDASGAYAARKGGDEMPFNSREIKDRTFLFRIEQGPGPRTYFLGVKSYDSIGFHLNMLTNDAYVDRLRRELPAYWLFFGLLLVMALYNLFFFISSRVIGNLYLVCFIISYGLLEIIFKGFAFQYLWPDSVWLQRHANPFVEGMVIISISLFMFDFVRKGQKRRYFIILLALLAMIVGSSLLTMLLSLIVDTRTSMLLMYAIAAGATGGFVLFGIYIGFIERPTPAARQVRIVLLAFSLFALSVPLVILNMLGVISSGFVTLWALPIGTAAAIVLLSFALADKINSMRSMIRRGEVRYRHLVESTDDIIFTLDEKNNIHSMNRAVRFHLGYHPDEVLGANFPDLFSNMEENRFNITQQIVMEYITTLKKKKKGSVRFLTTLNDKYSHEPKEMAVTLEYKGEGNTGYVILGKAYPVIDDALTPFLVSEEYAYEINNYIGNAELMSQRLARNLGRYMEPGDISDVRIALREAIINAIEHGNLGLGFEEKTATQLSGSYFNLIKRRQKDPAYGGRRVHVECSLNAARVVYTVADEGAGFNHSAVADGDPEDDGASMLMHGRGLLMIRHAFDEVRFNERGNRIVMVRMFRR